MRLGPIPENLLERMLLAANVVPVPIADTMGALLLARTVMTATSLGIFDALADGARSARAVAAVCGTDLQATGKLLFALAGSRYLQVADDRYVLAPMARKILLQSSPGSVRDAVLHRYLDVALLEHAEEFVRTGQCAEFHANLTSGEWGLYQRGQRAHAVFSAREVARRMPIRANPERMLDVGGGHGYYSVALCRWYPALRSTILDLPQAAEHSAPALAREDVADRVDYRTGNALTEDLGHGVYDLILVANLIHHFDEPGNRDLMRRIGAALRPGGYCVILEFFRSTSARRAGQIGALLDFYFAISSAAGTWSFGEVARWQRDAGLVPRRPLRLRTGPGQGLQIARRP
jgi:2-polyprenyl-3-methyl-5-hydroxy-6-metoxy-1,4-benzoquinol methylase